ncbi:NAD(P)/FAD-dependent oxidoreductase [Listeria sp. PSOL-1]|uniref:NAD(P)/FAD-dependent oxidoreductase n=1 Tax=Listeria sp. PSOL-1 TaxID=1844999 RepID=UPI0013D7DC83|nr:NAD(P)/FAD-dependent oxidoreductase [Listeria sp. PSOL-1]
MKFDVIVVGGGPSGLMAAIQAAKRGAAVLLIEKGQKLGRKLILSGGGRCNVTNRRPVDEIIKHIPGNGRFLYSAFHEFNNEDIIRFFENLGVSLKEEDHGRMFPVSNDARSVAEALIHRLKQLNVKIYTNTTVKKLIYEKSATTGVILQSGEKISAKAVIVAVGGKAVPRTGSTGDGYAWAKDAGHTITELYPTEVPLISEETFIKQRLLQGISLRDVSLSVLNQKKKPVITHQMDMIFTHFGISGPAALRCSMFVQRELKKQQPVMMKLDLFPELSSAEIMQKVLSLLKNSPKKALKNALHSLEQEKLLLFLLAQAELDPEQVCQQASPKRLEVFCALLKDFRFFVSGTLSFDKAFVTGGGVSVKEIIPQEMASKCKDGLYFCGEILDINGYTGGYNITCALVTGYVAGEHAGERAYTK